MACKDFLRMHPQCRGDPNPHQARGQHPPGWIQPPILPAARPVYVGVPASVIPLDPVQGARNPRPAAHTRGLHAACSGNATGWADMDEDEASDSEDHAHKGMEWAAAPVAPPPCTFRSYR